MNLKYKRINFLGDSVTSGCMTSSEDKRFTNIIAANTGSFCSNFGIPGTKVAKTAVLDPVPHKRLDFCGRVKMINPLAVCTFVFGGSNDFGHDIPLGNLEDRSPYTFYGALHKIYNDIPTYAPHSKVVFITPLHRQSELTNPVNKVGNTLEEYVNAVKDVAGFYGCPVLDLYNWDGFDLRKEEDRAVYGEDGLHPNDAGHEVLAKVITEFLENSLD